MATDYVPRSESILISFLDNIVAKMAAYANDFKMNIIDIDKPFSGEVPAGSIVLALYGRLPDVVTVRVPNTGTVSLTFSINAVNEGALQVPTTSVDAGASVDVTIGAIGGAGRPFLRIENTNVGTDGSYTIFTTRLGRIINAADSILRELSLTNQMRTDYQQQVDTKNTVKKNNTSLLRDEFQDMKEDNKYTTAIGEDLDIIAAKPIIDEDNATPELTAKKVPTGWSIGYNLLGYFDGITINRKRPADAGFSFWKQRTTGKSVIDTDPMVNGTQYQAYFMIGDELVGQPSDILTISV